MMSEGAQNISDSSAPLPLGTQSDLDMTSRGASPIHGSATPPLSATPEDISDSAVPDGMRTPPNTEPLDAASLGDSPWSHSMAQTIQALNSPLEDQRTYLLFDLGLHAAQFPTQYFRTDLLPPIPNGIDVESVVKRLHASQTLMEGRGWSVFIDTSSSVSENENRTFARLPDIFTSIDNCIPQKCKKKKRLTYYANPYVSPDGVKKGGAVPDGCTIELEEERVRDRRLRPSVSRPARADAQVCDPARNRATANDENHADGIKQYRWCNIGSTWEDKLSGGLGARDDNTRKIVFGMNRIMSDPQRRHVYGIAIGKTAVRIWYADRSMVVVSEEFDLMKDPSMFVHLYISLTYSEDESKVNHGWDPTLKLTSRQESTKKNPKTQEEVEKVSCEYEIVHRGHTYTNAQIIHDKSTRRFLTRAARIFRAKDQATKKTVIIKDLWLGDTRTPEYEIYKDIREGVKATVRERRFGHNNHAEEIADDDPEVMDEMQYFLTPRLDYCGPVMLDENRQDRTFRNNLPQARKFLFKAKQDTWQDPTGQGYIPPPGSDDHQDGQDMELEFISRTHIRTICEEYGITLYKVTTFKDGLVILSGASNALATMHRLRWVHRDVSCGNVYLFVGPNGKRGLLGDLEYSKRWGTGPSRDVRTGTLDFMAIEVAFERYLFQPKPQGPQHHNVGSADEKKRRLEAIKEGLTGTSSSRAEKTLPFMHNPLHDMESVWWCTLWLFFNKVDPDYQYDPPVENSQLTQWKAKASHAYAWFHNPQNSNKRWELMTRENDVGQAVESLIPTIRMLAEATIVDLHTILLDRYAQAEADAHGIDEGAFGQDLHQEFINTFSLTAEDDSLSNYSLVTPPLPKPKRPASPTAAAQTPAADADALIATAPAAAAPDDNALASGSSAQHVPALAPPSPSASASEPGPSSRPSSATVPGPSESGQKRRDMSPTTPERPVPKRVKKSDEPHPR